MNIPVIISIVLLIASCVGVVFIVSKKIYVLGTIDVESLPEERDAKLKDKIVQQRMQRKFENTKRFFKIFTQPFRSLWAMLSLRMKKMYMGITDLRETHRRASVVGGASLSNDEEKNQQKVTLLLHEAEAFIDQERFADAEARCIEAISLDARSIDPYLYLGEVYIQKKEWDHARETLAHASRLQLEALSYGDGSCDPQEAAVTLYELSEVYRNTGEFEQGLEEIRKAVELDPKNPKFLDALVETHINLRQRLRAERALVKLRMVNPDNKKIEEFDDRIRELSY